MSNSIHPNELGTKAFHFHQPTQTAIIMYTIVILNQLFMLVIEQHCESLCIPIEVVYNSILPLNRRYSALFGRWGILYGLE